MAYPFKSFIKLQDEENNMSTMITLGEVYDRVDKMSRNCTDKMVPVSTISFNGLNSMNINGEPHTMREIAQRSVASRLGIPIQYLRKCDQEIQAYNLNHWIRKETNNELFVRFDGDDVRALFTPRYQPCDNFEITEQLDSLGYSPDIKVQCHLDDNFMLLNIPDPEKEFKITKEDKMRPGISISNSEVGLSSLTIAAFVLRLICTNGMITKDETNSSYRHVSVKVLSEFPQVLSGVAAQLVNQRDRFMISMDSKVSNPEMTFSSFNRQFALNEPERDAVEWAWPQEMGETMYNVVNTYTKAAQFPELPAESSYRLQRVGGSILALVN